MTAATDGADRRVMEQERAAFGIEWDALLDAMVAEWDEQWADFVTQTPSGQWADRRFDDYDLDGPIELPPDTARTLGRLIELRSLALRIGAWSEIEPRIRAIRRADGSAPSEAAPVAAPLPFDPDALLAPPTTSVRKGFYVVGASDGAEALERVREHLGEQVPGGIAEVEVIAAYDQWGTMFGPIFVAPPSSVETPAPWSAGPTYAEAVSWIHEAAGDETTDPWEGEVHPEALFRRNGAVVHLLIDENDHLYERRYLVLVEATPLA